MEALARYRAALPLRRRLGPDIIRRKGGRAELHIIARSDVSDRVSSTNVPSGAHAHTSDYNPNNGRKSQLPLHCVGAQAPSTTARSEPLRGAAYASDACNVSSEDPRFEPVEEDEEPGARADLIRGQRGWGSVKMRCTSCTERSGRGKECGSTVESASETRRPDPHSPLARRARAPVWERWCLLRLSLLQGSPCAWRRPPSHLLDDIHAPPEQEARRTSLR
eukprot:scaffold17676_cov108-Isochrysis_galbana.AAC.5